MVSDEVRKQRGKFGEDYACEYLTDRGYVIIGRNYHRRCGEIDIIAKKDDTLHFVEVKTRKFGSLVSGTEAVDLKKRDKIRKTVELYIQEYDDYNYISIDVMEITITTDLRILEVAFYPDSINGWNK